MTLMLTQLQALGLKPSLGWADLPQVAPSSTEHLAETMKLVAAEGWRVLAIGSGSKAPESAFAGVDLVLSTSQLQRVIAHAAGDLTVTTEAGLRFAQLQSQLKAAGQMLALDPAFAAQASLGGILATADTGARRLRYGGVRDMVLGLTFVRADGEIAHAGGRVVKNVAGYDLMKLFTGAWGSLGIVTEMTWRLYPLPQASATVVFRGTADAIAQVWPSLRALAPVAADCCTAALSQALGWGNQLSVVVQFQSIAAAVAEQVDAAIALGCEALSPEPWRELDQNLRHDHPNPDLWRLKLGVLPDRAIATTAWLTATYPELVGRIQGGTGLGELVADSELDYRAIRQHCESQQGFVSVLQGLSQTRPQEIWGYSEDTLQLMRALKHRFDPRNCLHPSYL